MAKNANESQTEWIGNPLVHYVHIFTLIQTHAEAHTQNMQTHTNTIALRL